MNAETRRLKRQHRRVMARDRNPIALKAWCRYIANGTGEWPQRAQAWLRRKAAA